MFWMFLNSNIPSMLAATHFASWRTWTRHFKNTNWRVRPGWLKYSTSTRPQLRQSETVGNLLLDPLCSTTIWHCGHIPCLPLNKLISGHFNVESRSFLCGREFHFRLLEWIHLCGFWQRASSCDPGGVLVILQDSLKWTLLLTLTWYLINQLQDKLYKDNSVTFFYNLLLLLLLHGCLDKRSFCLNSVRRRIATTWRKVAHLSSWTPQVSF